MVPSHFVTAVEKPDTMRKIFCLLFSIVFLCLLAGAQTQPQEKEKRSPSTPEERKRFLAVAHKIVKSPLDDSLKSEIKWALQWLSDIPDVNVDPCPAPLGELAASGNRYSARIFGIYVLSMGAFVIEHPDKSKDTNAQYMAGVDAALKAYKAILRTDSEASSEDLDDLLQKQATGKLDEFIQTAGKVCTAPASPAN